MWLQRAHNWDEDERQLPSAAAINSTGPAGWQVILPITCFSCHRVEHCLSCTVMSIF